MTGKIQTVREAERMVPFGNSQEAERTAQTEKNSRKAERTTQSGSHSTIKTETMEMPEGEIQFELSDFEDDFNEGDLQQITGSEFCNSHPRSEERRVGKECRL